MNGNVRKKGTSYKKRLKDNIEMISLNDSVDIINNVTILYF